MDILDHIRDEKEALKKAPLAFGLLTLLAFIAAVIVVDWLHADRFASSKQEVDTVKQQNDLLNARVNGKDDQLNDYRAQLSALQSKDNSKGKRLPTRQQFSASTSRFSGRSNEELRTMAVSLAQQIRGVSQRAKKVFDTNHTSEEYAAVMREAENEYENKYQADAVVLRDEILSRLPLLQRPVWENTLYQAHNANVLDEVARDLETL